MKFDSNRNCEEVGVIPFVDKLHLIMAGKGSEGGGVDAGKYKIHEACLESSMIFLANSLKPVLAQGKLRSICATTLAEYQRYTGQNNAFRART